MNVAGASGRVGARAATFVVRALLRSRRGLRGREKRPCYNPAMTMNMLTSAMALSNRDLLARIPQLVANERKATAELVAHLAALELREDAYAAAGYGSLYAYCTEALHLSEDAACTRIAVLGTCRRFPAILNLLAAGKLNLTGVRRLGPHLTPENYEAVLARAVNRRRSEIEVLIAELAPQPDVTPSVRKLPSRGQEARPPVPPGQASLGMASDATAPRPVQPEAMPAATPPPQPPVPRPVIQPSAPERYRVQFNISSATHAKLRRVQALLRREIPSGDPGLIFDQALDLLLEKVEKAKLGKATRRRRPAIRFETDEKSKENGTSGRAIPDAIKWAVSQRDGERCAFVALDGTRCGERSFLEFHHDPPFAHTRRHRVEEISLRCRRHNQYEARLVFGAHGAPRTGESRAGSPAG
ncbi:MAG TPA: hypothetical protein VFM29_03025 [Vicinamibacteria bacterium]|nr:hypothetical protein [Vicinamibacteria bacterium]